MRSFRRWILCCTAVLVAGIAAADDGKPDELPPDGSWARYHVVRTENDVEHNSQIELRWVGRVERNDEWCRRIEVEEKSADGHRSVHQMLVRERDLLTKAEPLGATLDYLFCSGGKPVERYDTQFCKHFGMYLFFLPGTLKQATRIEESRTVDHPQGELQVDSAWKGDVDWGRQALTVDYFYSYRTQYKVWMHEAVLGGFAHAATSWTFHRDGDPFRTATYEFSLEEFGEGARPMFTAADLGTVVIE